LYKPAIKECLVKKIPLHSLVIVITKNKTDDLIFKNVFPVHEAISTQQVHYDLVGELLRPELDSIIRNEVFRRCALKLSLGERVVFHGAELTKDQRMALAKMASSQGSPVYYLVGKDVNLTSLNDGIGEVVTSAEPAYPVDLQNLRKSFRGITVVGDVHGDVDLLREAVSWAKSRNHFIFFLGDIIDYGPKPLQAMDVVHSLVMEGSASMLIGNHERKIAKWIQQKDETGGNRLRLSDGNKVTIKALNSLSSIEQMNWIGKFRSVIARSSLIVSIENITLAHAAIHPDYWASGKSNDIENYALYGEPDQTVFPEFRLSHNWIEKIPDGQIVLVGHESSKFPYPIFIPCQSGGKVVFLDTGCGKGGYLSTADIQFGDENAPLKLGNFNRHVGQ
jgi:hypothetical protein